jgi:Txe/YoeB family toxin of toxin-antitoxin system
VSYKVVLTKQAIKDIAKLKTVNLSEKAKTILENMVINPYFQPYKKLSGDLREKFSRRLNIKHRIVYEIDEDAKVVKILNMWSHYE